MGRVIPILLIFMLSACAGKHELKECEGPLFQLNAGEWQPGPDDLKLSSVKP
jgi:hypothetical protein